MILSSEVGVLECRRIIFWSRIVCAPAKCCWYWTVKGEVVDDESSEFYASRPGLTASGSFATLWSWPTKNSQREGEKATPAISSPLQKVFGYKSQGC